MDRKRVHKAVPHCRSWRGAGHIFFLSKWFETTNHQMKLLTKLHEMTKIPFHKMHSTKRCLASNPRIPRVPPVMTKSPVETCLLQYTGKNHRSKHDLRNWEQIIVNNMNRKRCSAKTRSTTKKHFHRNLETWRYRSNGFLCSWGSRGYGRAFLLHLKETRGEQRVYFVSIWPTNHPLRDIQREGYSL